MVMHLIGWEMSLMNSAAKQAVALQLVNLHEVKLSLRPDSSTIPTSITISQSVVCYLYYYIINLFD